MRVFGGLDPAVAAFLAGVYVFLCIVIIALADLLMGRDDVSLFGGSYFCSIRTVVVVDYLVVGVDNDSA